MVMSEDFIQQWMDSPQTSVLRTPNQDGRWPKTMPWLHSTDSGTTFNFADLDDSEEEAVDFNAIFNDPTGCVGCAE